MVEEVRKELGRQAEKKAAQKRREKERRIQERLISLIKKYNLQIKQLEEDIKILWQKEQQYTSQGKTFRAKLAKWWRQKKQEKLSDLKKVTPSIKFQ